MRTVIGVNSPQAVKKYSLFLASDIAKESYFGRKFTGHGVNSEMPLQTLTELESDQGDNISFDVVMQLRGKPVRGDDKLRGKEENLRVYTDNVYIDQLRGGVSSGGRMTRKRTIRNLRDLSRTKQAEWWARIFDEAWFMYLSGARGGNDDFIEDQDFTDYANNPLVPPDSQHQLFCGAAVSKSTLTAADTFNLNMIDRAVVRSKTMGGGTKGVPALQPIKVNGESHFVCVLHPFQAYDLRNEVGMGKWMDFQKAAATAEGRNNPIFKGGLGMHNNVVLHEHQNVIRFDDYGAGGDVHAARALFLGRQAGVVAFGSPGTGLRYDWHEETEDRGNELVVTTASIFGMKKTSFVIDGKRYDFGVMALDSAAADPNEA